MRFRLAPAIPPSPLIARAVSGAVEKALRKSGAGGIKLKGGKAELEADRWVSVPVKGATVTELSSLDELGPRLIGYVNELGESAARLAQRLGG